MSLTVIVLISIGVLIALVVLTVATIREFRKMDRKPDEFTGSDRMAGSAE